MSEFVAGFSGRHARVAAALNAAFAMPGGFENLDIKARASGGGPPSPSEPASASASASDDGPRHFTPLDPGSNPTAGWDPFDASGTDTGFIDPVAAAHAAGYAEGVAAALAQARTDSDRDRTLADALGAALGEGVGFDRERIARQLRQTVLLLVGKLVGEVGVSGELLATRIESAVGCLADAAESAILRVHPDDVALLHAKLPRTLFPVGDPQVERGSFVLESASTIIEDGPGHWLEQLGHAIERVAVPTC